MSIWEEVESFSIEELSNTIANDNPDRRFVAAIEIICRAKRETWPNWERMSHKLAQVSILINDIGKYADQHDQAEKRYCQQLESEA